VKYKTEHPTITEITIGDEFITRGGYKIKFIRFEKSENYPFMFTISPYKFDVFYTTSPYAKRLTYFYADVEHSYDIICRYINLKDKLSVF